MLVTVEGIDNTSILVQLLKAFLPIVVTPSGIVREVIPIHPSNALSSIVVTFHVTPLGIIMFERLVHPSNALIPMEVILDVNGRMVKLVQFLKA